MRYLATESGLVLAERERPLVAAPELWIPRSGSVFDLPPMREPYQRLPKAEAFGVAGAFGTVMMGSGGPVTPLTIFGSRCQQWLKAIDGPQLATNPFSSGSSPPAVTISGQPVSPFEFRIEVNDVTGGTALGQAKYRYGVGNNGSSGTWIETGLTTAATHNCIGLATGIQIQFPAGPYAANNVYQGIIASCQDRSGFGNNATNPTSGVQLYQTAYGGVPALAFLGGYLTTSSLVLGSGNDQPFAVFMPAQLASVTSANGVIFGTGHTTDVNLPLYDLQLSIATPTWTFSKRDNTATTKTTSGGTPDTGRHVYALISDGTTQSFWIDNTQITLGSSGDINVGTMTCNRMTIGARVSTVVTLACGMNVPEFWGIAGSVTAQEIAVAIATLRSKYP